MATDTGYRIHVRSELFNQLLMPARLPAACTAHRILAVRHRLASAAPHGQKMSRSSWLGILQEQLQISTQLASSLFSLCTSFLNRFVVQKDTKYRYTVQCTVPVPLQKIKTGDMLCGKFVSNQKQTKNAKWWVVINFFLLEEWGACLTIQFAASYVFFRFFL
jgi:hypothetical protein